MKIMNYNDFENCPKEIDDLLLHEDWAQKIHSQTLKRLNERGGLSPFEIFMNVNKISYRDAIEHFPQGDEQAIIWLKDFLELDKAISDAC